MVRVSAEAPKEAVAGVEVEKTPGLLGGRMIGRERVRSRCGFLSMNYGTVTFIATDKIINLNFY